MSIPRHWVPHNAEPEPFIPPLSMLQPGSAAGGASSHSHRRHSSTPVSISRVPSSQAIVDMNVNRTRPSPIPMHPHQHPSFRPSNPPPPPPPTGPRSNFPQASIPIPMPHRPRTIAPGHSNEHRDEADYPQSFPPRYVPFNGDTPAQPGLGLFESQAPAAPPLPSPSHEHPKREHHHRGREREFERERAHEREHEREDVVMLGTSVEEMNPINSGEAEAMLKAQHDLADKLWEEEQERLRKEVEEEKRKYDEEKSLGLPHHSPASPVTAPNPTFQSRSRSHSNTQLSTSHSASDRHAPAPQPQGSNEEMVTTPPPMPSPPSQAATRCVSTKDERERWRREIRQAMEEHVRRQTTAKEEAERAMREALVAAERRERERYEAEQRMQQQQQAQQVQEQVQEEVEEEEDEESMAESVEETKRKRRASSVRTKSKTKSVISSSTRVETTKRKDQKDARRWARRREDERRHSRYYRRSQRLGGRRFADRSDAWSRSGVGGPFRPRPRSLASRSRPQSQIGLDAGLDAFGFGIYDSETGEAEEFKDTDVSEAYDESYETDVDQELGETMVAAWNNYENQWNRILKNPPVPNSLRFVDIPWPTAEPLPVPTQSPLKSLPPSSDQVADILNNRSISDFVLSPYHSQNKSNEVRIRSTMSRYHPDRVMRWSNLVQESERMAVVMGAEIVVNALNDMMERLSDDTNVDG
ncbi:hypothetical protein FRC02_001876 [Tulasnella sp. 418]|nr:hypothetical protein FRC02_001876 [Tulasnella sp. 418]